MTAAPEVRRYPFGAPFRLEIDPNFVRLRRDDPISRVQLPYGGEGWLVTRHADAKVVLTDQRFSRAVTIGRHDLPRIMPTPTRPTSILSLDPPEHSRLRKLVAKTFTSRRVEELRPRVREIVEEKLTEIERCGPPADLVSRLALPLPVTVICEMLGVPPQDQHRFRAFSDALLTTTAYDPEQIAAARSALDSYLIELIAQRRAHPTDDLLGALVHARDNDDRLSENELITLSQELLVAGHETTSNEVANFVYLLLTNRDQWEMLYDRTELVPVAVEELLRFVPLNTSGQLPRVATEDLELGGVTIKAGESVFVNAQSANRDEDVFADPTELNLLRQHNPHLAFGHGVHHCLGSQLARVELQEAIGALLRRFPSLRLAVPLEDVPWKVGLMVRGPKTLAVMW
ncbi:nocardicin N-oxygenase [Nocardia tenerifensis]|uniref:Nocardicin N-oxygenase n=1 Tax=Nocardia tenerifensis TaxID=228006 RepID=A0A318KEY8_9NOCA|nr:cytochrome P450 [Nocardia tenerifensis]PXX71505.1 nocardicin N-oxygenase [Nocardia tenerifensis]